MEIRVPDIGDFADVPIIEILVAEGDTVSPEDPLVTLESDKATMDVPAPTAGTVTKLHVALEQRVKEGDLLLEVEPATAEAEAPAPMTSEPAPEPVPAPAPAAALAGDPARDAQVVVIGSGPGGYTAAFRCADLGLRTILIEREERLGGVCLNVGCIPSKALLHAARVIAEGEEMAAHGVAFGRPKIDLGALVDWKDSVVDKLTGGLTQMARARRVEVVRGEAALVDAHSLRVGGRTISFDAAILAVGSRWVDLPFLPEDERIVDSTGALAPTSIPKRFLVIGGGIIGLEMACVYDALGAQVTVVEMADQLMPGADPDLVKPLHQRIAGRYSAVLTGTQVSAATAQRNGIKVEFTGTGAPPPATFDRVLVAVGRRPNGDRFDPGSSGLTVDERGYVRVDAQMRTNVANLFAIGDLVGPPMLAHKATHEAKVAAEVIAGQLAGTPVERLPVFDPRAIPSVAYTDPEVAWMGLTETAARADGVAYEKQVFPWSASGRALGLGRPEGMTKLLFEAGDDDAHRGERRLLGAGIVGIGAGDLIAETVHGLEMGASAEDLGLTVHPHPTLSETLAFAAELQTGAITDLPQPRRRR